MSSLKDMNQEKETELQAAAFRALRDHLQSRTDVQNIDMMNLAGFCRNCLSRWVQEAGTSSGLEITRDDAREYIYGMPYEDWREQFQTEATEAQKGAFKNSHN